MRLLAILLLMSLSAFAADDKSWQIGEELQYRLPVCAFKDGAVRVVQTEATEGFQASAKVFDSDPECAILPVFNATVGKVVHVVKVKRDDKDITLSVVEIIVDEKPVAYFITVLPVVARLSVLPQRNS